MREQRAINIHRGEEIRYFTVNFPQTKNFVRKLLSLKLDLKQPGRLDKTI